MLNTDWSKLSAQQLGAYGEIFGKMCFLSYGMDVYSSEVDDHGVDLVIKDKKKPVVYIIPSSAWNNPDGVLLVSRDYPEGKSEPEFGINVTKKMPAFRGWHCVMILPLKKALLQKFPDRRQGRRQQLCVYISANAFSTS